MITKDLGVVTAYAYAVLGGYTGTEEEFTELLGNIATDLEEIENLSVTATTLPEGSSATASYSDGVLTLGIPRGNTGATGNGISSVVLNADYTLTINYTNGQHVTTTSIRGSKGDTGNGIASIYKTAESGAVKTYTILYTNGDTFDFDVTDGEVTNASLATTLEDYAKVDGYYDSMTVGNAEQLVGTTFEEDNAPYLFRTSGGSIDIGDREYDKIVGGTVAWNQLTDPTVSTTVLKSEARSKSAPIPQGSSIVNGHKYFFSVDFSNVANVSEKAYVQIIVRNNDGNDAIVNVQRTSNGQEQKIFSSSYNATSLGTTTQTVGNMWLFNAVPATEADNATFTASKVQLIDLTQMFGSTIADHIYALEQATAGKGVEFFRKLFPKPYYAYDAGSLKSVSGLKSHDMTGFNQLISYVSNDTKVAYQSLLNGTMSKMIEGATYCISFDLTGATSSSEYIYLNEAMRTNFVGWAPASLGNGRYSATFVAKAGINDLGENAILIKNGGTQPTSLIISNVCINLSWDGERNGEYEPYELHSYPLDDSLTLRGIPKLDASNKLYYNGDEYEADGTVTRKYGIVDLGTLDWTKNNPYFKATVSGLKYVPNNTTLGNAVAEKYVTRIGSGMSTAVKGQLAVDVSDIKVCTGDMTLYPSGYLVYELATPTTESADPYQNPQIVNDFGTEEYVLASDAFPMPVGHVTQYQPNLRAKLEMAPNSPDGAGDYIVRQTSGTNEYVELTDNTTIQGILAKLPAPPSSDGTYTLTVTVSSGTATYSWEA